MEHALQSARNDNVGIIQYIVYISIDILLERCMYGQLSTVEVSYRLFVHDCSRSNVFDHVLEWLWVELIIM